MKQLQKGGNFYVLVLRRRISREESLTKLSNAVKHLIQQANNEGVELGVDISARYGFDALKIFVNDLQDNDSFDKVIQIFEKLYTPGASSELP